MAVVATAFTAIAGAFQATALGTFLATGFGRFLASVAISALRAAIARNNQPGDPGIRTSQTQTGGTTPASFILGRYATEGQLAAPPMSHKEQGSRTPNNMLNYVIELGDIPGQQLEGLIIDGEEVTIGTTADPDYGLPLEGRFTDKAWIKFYDGTQTAADTMLLDKYGSDPDRPWTADMVGEGLVYAILTFKFDRKVFSGFPRTRFVLTGIPLYDPRLDSTVGGSGSQRWNDRTTWQPSTNAMVMIYNILRGIDLGGGQIWGGRCDARDLPLPHWFTAMNKCDAPRVLDGGGSEPMYRAGYEVYCKDEPAQVVDELLKACTGEIAEMGGQFIPRVGGPGLPVYFFTDDDIVLDDPRELDPYPAPDQTYNAVSATYPDPASLWEPREAPLRQDALAIAADGEVNTADLQLEAAPYPVQVQHIMKETLAEERRFKRHRLSLPSDAIKLQVLDAISWTSARHGYAGKVFEITRILDPVLTGRPRIEARERDPSDNAWAPTDQVNLDAPALSSSSEIYIEQPALFELDLSVGQAVATNLLTNTDFADGDADYLVSGSGNAHDDAVTEIRAAGQPGAGATFPTFVLFQNSGDTAGFTRVAYRPAYDDGVPGPGTPVTEGQWVEFQLRAAVRRCTFSARIRWYDQYAVELGISGLLFEQIGDTAPSTVDPLAWDVLSGAVEVPAGAFFASIELTKEGTHNGATPATSAVYFWAPQLAITIEQADTLVPYSIGGVTMIAGQRLLAGAMGPIEDIVEVNAAQFNDADVIFQQVLRPRVSGRTWQVGFSLEFRAASTKAATEVRLQMRYSPTGTWNTIFFTGDTSGTWKGFGEAELQFGPRDYIEVRARVGTTGGATQTNVRDVWFNVQERIK